MRYTVKVKKPESLSQFIQSHELKISLPCGGCMRCGRCRIQVSGDISPVSESELRLLAPEDIKNNIRLACFTTVYSECTIILPDETELHHSADSVVIDLGTTTIEAEYSDGTKFKMKNPQQAYGADVITRISSRRRSEMHSCILSAVKNLINGCSSAIIAGNTAMLSILTGKSTEGMAKYPFCPESLFDCTEKIDSTDIYYPRCVSAFIGADILCSVIFEKITSSTKPVILCDVGTNTEIALWNGEKLFFTSAPSGPAFEGGNISCGTSAQDGAICKIYEQDKKLMFNTVNSAPAASICGSALIDAAAFMLSKGIINKNGRIMEYGHRFSQLVSFRTGETAFNIGNSGVFITQSDIRALQTAKSAIFSAITMLIKHAELTDTPPIILAGNFGMHLNKQNAVQIRLFPNTDFKTSPHCVIGGAAMMNNESNRRLAAEIASEAAVIELALDDQFMDIFTQNMDFI